MASWYSKLAESRENSESTFVIVDLRSILSRSSIFDVKETSIDMDILKRNIQFIAESLAVYMYAPVSIVIMFI